MSGLAGFKSSPVAKAQIYWEFCKGVRRAYHKIEMMFVQFKDKMAHNLTHKIIKGVPVLTDKENNVYMFAQQTPKENLVCIGTTDGVSLTLCDDWRDRASDFLQHYRTSLLSFQRIEHAKAVKYIKKPATTTKRTSASSVTSSAAGAADSADAAITSSMPADASKPSSKERKAKVESDRRPNPRQPRNKSKSAQSSDNNA